MKVYLVHYHDMIEEGSHIHYATLDEQKANAYVERNMKAQQRVDVLDRLHEEWYNKEDGFTDLSQEEVNARIIELGYTRDEVAQWRKYGNVGSGWYVQAMELDKE